MFAQMIILFIVFGCLTKDVFSLSTSTSPCDECQTRLDLVEVKTELSETLNKVVHQDMILVQKMLGNMQKTDAETFRNLSEETATCSNIAHQYNSSLQLSLDSHESKILKEIQMQDQHRNQVLQTLQERIDLIERNMTNVKSNLESISETIATNTQVLSSMQVRMNNITSNFATLMHVMRNFSNELAVFPAGKENKQFRYNITEMLISVAQIQEKQNQEMKNISDELTVIKDMLLSSSNKGEGYIRGCHEVTRTGVFTINPFPGEFINVYCKATETNGTWTVIQNRKDGNVDFNRSWVDYKNGFGDLRGDFWIGNDIIYLLTRTPSTLRIEMEAMNGTAKYAEYSYFQISNEAGKYKLYIRGFSGSVARDAMAYHHGRRFSTFDQDNDEDDSRNCAAVASSGWWYKWCYQANTNAIIKENYSGAMAWKDFFHIRSGDDVLRSSQMLVKNVKRMG